MNRFEVGARVKVEMPKGIMVGKVSMCRVMEDGTIYYYVTPERVFKDGRLLPPPEVFETGIKPLCIPANAMIMKQMG